jgi:hypothetical protein
MSLFQQPSFVQYTGNGALRQYAVPFPYLERSHVIATLGGVEQPFVWVNAQLIELATAPANGVTFTVRRRTPSATVLVDFESGSALQDEDLDLVAKQALYVSQEALDIAQAGATLSDDGTLDVQGRRIKNVGAPVAANDAARKADVDGVVAASGAAAAASAAAALASQNAAAASATAANNVVTSGTVGAVRHDVVQSLTSPQQTQARANMGSAALAGAPAQTFSVAPASANEHAVSRVFGDGRYDRITTSPTALTNGATIPSTENGRFYSMALPTHQTALLPSTGGLMDGFSVIVYATGLPSGYATAWISGNGKNILYRDYAAFLFNMIGNGEIFRFTWLSGLDQWIAECLRHPAEVRMSRSHNGTTWTSGATAFTNLPYNLLGGDHPQFDVTSSSITRPPVTGVYQYRHRAYMSAMSGGGTSGQANFIGTDIDTGTGNSSEDYETKWLQFNEDQSNFNIHNTRVLNPGDIISARYSMSVTTVWIFHGNNLQIVTLVSR